MLDNSLLLLFWNNKMEKQLNREEMLKKSGELIEVLRKQLGSITLKDLKESEEPQLTDAEYNERAASAELFFMHYMEKILNILEHKQLVEIGTKAQNDLQMIFGRGTINGLYLIKEWFQEQVSHSRSRFTPMEKTEPGEIL